ncbi:MAG: hypothetical protein IRY99_11385 [Isosphaeraceae bacterium]|nr:hypothetical protein [Isosphaeraceae bacterium]
MDKPDKAGKLTDDEFGEIVTEDRVSPSELWALLGSVWLRVYAYHIAASLAAFLFAGVRRDYRLALIGAGLWIRPAASLVAMSDASEGVKAAAAKSARVLRAVFVAYCVYVMFQALQGR